MRARFISFCASGQMEPASTQRGEQGHLDEGYVPFIETSEGGTLGFKDTGLVARTSSQSSAHFQEGAGRSSHFLERDGDQALGFDDTRSGRTARDWDL